MGDRKIQQNINQTQTTTDMDKKQRKRYILAVYLVVALLATVFGLVGVNYFAPDNPLQSLLLNLATEFAGVVLIFFIVNQLFALNEDEAITNLGGQIDALLKEMPSQNLVLLQHNKAQDHFDIAQIFSKYERIDLLGYTQKTIFSDGRFRTAMTEAIKRGVAVRVIIVDANSIAGELMRQHSLYPKLVDQDFEQTLNFASKVQQDVEGSIGYFELHLMSWIPSCGMFIGYNQNGNGEAKIDINLPSLRQSRAERRSIIIRSTLHPKDFKHFIEQFNLIWENDSHQHIQNDNSLASTLPA